MYINGRFLKMKKKRKNYQYDMQKYNGIKRERKEWPKGQVVNIASEGLPTGTFRLLLSYLIFSSNDYFIIYYYSSSRFPILKLQE